MTSLTRRLGRHLRARLLEGFLLVVPLVVTLLVLRFLVVFIDNLLQPLLRLINGPSAPWLPGLGVFLTLVLLYLIGVFVHSVLGRRVVGMVNSVIERIPFVRLIYRTARQATDVFAGVSTNRFHRVVLVEFPRPGVQALGFVTSRFQDAGGEEVLTVFIPTVPNPTSGFLLFLREDQVQGTDLTPDEALKLVLSGGILSSEVARFLVLGPREVVPIGREKDAEPQEGPGHQRPPR